MMTLDNAMAAQAEMRRDRAQATASRVAIEAQSCGDEIRSALI